MLDIWIWVQQRDGRIEDPTFGLAAEAGRLIRELDGQGQVTAVAIGAAGKDDLTTLGDWGVDRVLYLKDETNYQGEYVSGLLTDAISAGSPACLLAVKTAEIDDLFARLAAGLDTTLITRAMDLHLAPEGRATAVRPVANGFLFEEVSFEWHKPPLVSFLPSVLVDVQPGQTADDSRQKTAQIVDLNTNLDRNDLKTKVVEVIAAAPEDMDLEEADMIVAGGRGVGKDEAFDVIHELAGALGATVGATRPVIDWGTLPYERQIGQTGKYVAPKLIINCGISGANEYTAGMEKALKVIAIDENPRARIFRFADVGVVGNVHDILPRLTSRIKELKK